MSRKTTDQEKKYTSYELEMLAAIEAMKKFRIYLLGLKFKLITDCNAFQKTMQKKDLTARVARWILLLEEFDFVVEHRSGSRMKHVYCLSRNPINLINAENVTTKLRKAQETDEEIKLVREILREKAYKDYFIKDDILYKFANGQELLQTIRTAHERGKGLLHTPVTTKGRKKILNCIKCIMVNRKRGKQEGDLHPLYKEDSPLCTYHIDFLGPLESTNKKYKHILAVIDSLTKFVWLYPTKSTSTKDVIDKLEFQQKTFGNPSIVITDRETAFTSHEFEDYCKGQGIKPYKTTTGLPRANGQVEKLKASLLTFVVYIY